MNLSNEAISLFVDLCLGCVLEGISTLDRAFIQKAAQRIVNAPTPPGFVELCLLENAGENLPEVVSAARKKRYEEHENILGNSADELYAQATKAEAYAKECRERICKQEIRIRYLRNALRAFPS